MFYRFTRLIAVCAMAVGCPTGYAGLWDAPPQSNADFGGSNSKNSRTATKLVSAPVDATTTVPASCACDVGQGYGGQVYGGGQVYDGGQIYGAGQGGYPTTSAMAMPGAPAYSAPVPMQQYPAQQQEVIEHSAPVGQQYVVPQPPQAVPMGTPMVQQAPMIQTPAPMYVQPSPVMSAPVVQAPVQAPFPAAGFGGGAVVPVNAMGLAQSTYSGVGQQWGLFRPVVAAGGAWGGGRGRRRFYAGSEALFFKTRGQTFPALVTRSPLGTPIEEAGRLDYPLSTTTLFGGGRLGSNSHTGFRSFIGMNLDQAGRNRIEAEYFDLGQEDFFFEEQTPAGADILGRPFYNVFLDTEDAEIVGFPGIVDGRITVGGSTNFSGLGIWLRHSMLRCCPPPQPVCDPCGGVAGGGYASMGGGYALGGGGCGTGCGPIGGGCGPCGSGGGGSLCGPAGIGATTAGLGYGNAGGVIGGGIGSFYGTGGGFARRRWRTNRLDLIAGYRRYDLDEDLAIREYLVYVDPAGQIPQGMEFDILDRFRTDNRFDGADLGVDWEWTRGRLGLSVLGKMAFGNMRQRGSVDGQTIINPPVNPTITYPYGFMALESNSGTFEKNRFTVIPEVGLDVYWQLTCHSRFRIGYSMIYLPNVIRPNGLIDTNIDPRGLPPATANVRFPEQRFVEEDFWAQGLRIGAEYCF